MEFLPFRLPASRSFARTPKVSMEWVISNVPFFPVFRLIAYYFGAFWGFGPSVVTPPIRAPIVFDLPVMFFPRSPMIPFYLFSDCSN